MRLAFDLEASGLLDETTVDYTASPWKLKENFKVHCAVFLDVDTGTYYKFVQDECYSLLPSWLTSNATELIGNNIIDYDLPVMKAALGIDFTIYPDTLAGKPVKIWDNMVISKALNPDRPKHSVEYFGNLLGYPKMDWRAKAIELGVITRDSPSGAEFLKYVPEMLEYNTIDAEISAKIYSFLMKEWGDWKAWEGVVELESAVRDIISKQAHRGFWFDKELAEANVRDLDIRMEAIRTKVEPLIPPKPLPKTKLKELTPAKGQFLKSGELSSNIKNFVEKHGGELTQDESGTWHTELYGKKYTLPLPVEPLYSTEPAKLSSSAGDSSHLKGWLVELGWRPTQYKERDLTCDSKKKKLTTEAYQKAVERYVEQTLTSPFKRDRLDELNVRENKLMEKLMKHDISRPMKVYTNPTLTIGQEKEICPNLLLLGEQFPYAKDVSDYYSYTHRRNSILGGGVDLDAEGDDWQEPEKGFLSMVRESDGRVATPADTCGAGTSRFKHRGVANISRVTSIYGKEMRSMFGVDTKTHYQMGYDFAALESRIEAHYCWKYDDENHSYCNSLLGEKPNDVHTLTAKKISDVIGMPFARSPAKSVKYCCSYGGRPKRVAKTVGCTEDLGEMIFTAFWDAAAPLKMLADKLKAYWETTGGKKFILGIDGRKVPTRAAGALINSLFQSAGVICTKRAMVIHDRKLKERGLMVDFWRDDWKSKVFTQQMIAYHDEAQFEVDKSLVEWKMFKTEEEAVKFKQENAGWGEVGHTEKCWYVGKSIVGVLASESVKEAGEYYKLNCPLTADYIMGVNWATCH